MFKVTTSQVFMMTLVMCLLFIPQYSHGANYVPAKRAPGNCPYQYFTYPLPEKANFNKLKQVINVYGKRSVSDELRGLLNDNVTLRVSNFNFEASTGSPPLHQVDECSLMFDFLKLDISLTTLEKKIKGALLLAEQQRKLKIEQRRADIEKANREAKLAKQKLQAEQAKLAEQKRLAEQTKLAVQTRLAEQAKLAEKAKVAEEKIRIDEIKLAQEKRIAEEIRLTKTRSAEKARLAIRAKEKKFAALKNSAEHGEANSQYLLAIKYENGGVVQANKKESLRWYRLAAEQGHVEAQHMIGVIYVDGKGVDKDVEEGLLWLAKAAEQGSQESSRIISEYNTLRAQKRLAIVKGVTWLIIFVTIAFMFIKFRKNVKIIVKGIFTGTSNSIEWIGDKIPDIRWPSMSDIGLGAGVGCMYAVGCFIVGGVVTFIPVIGWFLGPIIILCGFMSPFVGVGGSFTQGDSEKYRHVCNPCPYCQHHVTVNVNDLGANCPACKKRFVLKGDKYFAV